MNTPNGADVLIRTGSPADAAAAVDVYQRTVAAQGRRPSKERLARVAEKMAHDLLVLAEIDDQLIGFALAEQARHAAGRGKPVSAALHIALLFVAPEHQRQGVGSALLEAVTDVAWARGYRTASVWSATPEFWVACGLAPTGQQQPLPDGRVAQQLSAVLDPPVRELPIGPGTRLGQLLKYAGLVPTGADARRVLDAGDVEVNGDVELRRGRQLVDGDEIRLGDERIRVRLPAQTQPS